MFSVERVVCLALPGFLVYGYGPAWPQGTCIGGKHMRGLKKAMFAALLVGVSYGCFPNCCSLKLPNLGKCFKAQPCEILFALLGGISL
jgi:hypothetical protein